MTNSNVRCFASDAFRAATRTRFSTTAFRRTLKFFGLGLVGRAFQKLSAYPWSSYPEYLKKPSRRVPWLHVNRLLGEMSIPKDTPAGIRQFQFNMEMRRREGEPEEWKKLRRGWCLGDKTFRKELLEQMGENAGDSHYGEELRESAEEKALHIIEAELKRLRWTEEDLVQRRKGDPKKVLIAGV